MIPPSLYGKNYGYGSNTIRICDLNLVTSENRIFTAIFPKISILNHSCDPNIRNSFNGSYLTIYAARDIVPNEEVFNCYGPNYKLMPKNDRQQALMQQYRFECKCEKCSTNDSAFTKFNNYICSNDNCRSIVEIQDIDAQWWNQIHSTRYRNKIMPHFTCKMCNTRLFLNPESLHTFFQARQPLSDDEYNEKTMITSLIQFYMTASKCLSKYHALKTKMAHLIFSYEISGNLIQNVLCFVCTK